MKIIKENQTNKNINISILISTYNKEKFIEKTLDSIVNQTMDQCNFEVIIVDDCSTDNTLNIATSKVEELYNYKLVQLNKNSGTPAEPRNLAIDLSIGDSIMFVDGDDWLPPDSVEKLYNLLITNKTDYATGLTKYVSNKNLSRAGANLAKISYKKIDLKKVRKSFYHLAPAGKMIKADIIKKNNIRFPEMIYGEDLQFFSEVLININKLSTTKDVVYVANRYTENVSLVKSKKSTLSNRMELQTKAYRYLSNKYKNYKIFKNLLYRMINKDVLDLKFYKKKFIEDIDEILPTLQKFLNEIELDFDLMSFAEDELNKHALKLIKNGDKEKIIKFLKWYFKKDKEGITYLKGKAYYKYEGELYKKKIHATLKSIFPKNGEVILKLYSKNSTIKYLEAKSRIDPSKFTILDIKKNYFKPGEYIVKFPSNNFPNEKIGLTVLDEDFNFSVIDLGFPIGFYETINGNLGFVKNR